MAIKQLSEEQVQSWTLEQKDRWWLENVFQPDAPQFTLRAGVMGFFLGFVLSVTNLYVGAKTGWSLGVGITSVILSYALFRALLGTWNQMFPRDPARPYHVLENNIVQSVACAAGYMTAPLISSLAAYMIVMTEQAGEPVVIPWWQAILWLFVLAILGVLFAFPMKRRFINDEQHPFPEGRAAGVVMHTLHSQEEGKVSAAPKLLIWSGIICALLKLGQSHAIMDKFWHGLLKVPERVAAWLRIPEYLDTWIYAIATPRIMGTPLRELTIRPELDIAMIGAGGLMGIRTGVSLMIGAVINYFILAPIMIERGDIQGIIDPDTGIASYGFRQITAWALWGGVAMMTTASLFAFFSKPQMLLKSFQGMIGGRGAGNEDPVKHIELPMWVFFAGIPFVGVATVVMARAFFGVPWYWAAVAIPLVFVFCLIAANSTALTSITPTGAMGKLTQLTFGILARGDVGTNLMTAGITGEVASNSSNLLMNIKPGYMLGAKPRLQALGHCLGAVAGALAAVGIFYPLFLRNDPAGLISEEYPFPAAAIWKAVAEILTEGLDKLPATAIWAAGIGAALGILMEIVKLLTRGKFKISAVGIGLAFVIPFTTCLAMFTGAFVFWLIEKLTSTESRFRKTVLENQEPICAGVIAGAALMGVATIALNVFVFAE
jgi:OPT family oligopeptide transporter